MKSVGIELILNSLLNGFWLRPIPVCLVAEAAVVGKINKTDRMTAGIGISSIQKVSFFSVAADSVIARRERLFVDAGRGLIRTRLWDDRDVSIALFNYSSSYRMSRPAVVFPASPAKHRIQMS